MSYHGWENYETWCVNLWLSNDEGLYFSVEEMKKHYEADEDAETEADDYGFAKAIKDLVEEFAPDTNGLYSDLLTHAINQANYEEIARAWLEN